MMTVSVRGRSEAAALATEIRTVPSPVPLAPLTIEIHDADSVAVQLQALSFAFTLMLNVPPLWSKVCDVALSENVQPDDCETVNVCPAIVSVPERAGPVVAA